MASGKRARVCQWLAARVVARPASLLPRAGPHDIQHLLSRSSPCSRGRAMTKALPPYAGGRAESHARGPAPLARRRDEGNALRQVFWLPGCLAYSPRIPARTNTSGQWLALRLSYPVTAAAPRRIRTCFPILPPTRAGTEVPTCASSLAESSSWVDRSSRLHTDCRPRTTTPTCQQYSIPDIGSQPQIVPSARRASCSPSGRDESWAPKRSVIARPPRAERPCLQASAPAGGRPTHGA
jgi:hypothetical protein